MSPPRLEKCINKVSKTIKPRSKKQSKKSAAYAVCTKTTGIKRKKGGGYTKGNK